MDLDPGLVRWAAKARTACAPGTPAPLPPAMEARRRVIVRNAVDAYMGNDQRRRPDVERADGDLRELQGLPRERPAQGGLEGFFDGLILGHDSSGTAAAGSFLSSLLLFGDVRDGARSLWRRDLRGAAWAGAAAVPGAGDLAKGLRLGHTLLDRARYVDDVGRLITKAPAHKVVELTRHYAGRTYFLGGHRLEFTRGDLRHVLERHHPEYWDGSIAPGTQSFLPRGTTIEHIEDVIGATVKAHGDQFRDLVVLPRRLQMRLEIDGRVWHVGFRDGRLRQVYAR